MPLLEHKQPVVFAGENHLITLFRPGGDQVVAAISCWRCTYSEHGEGYVLVVRSDSAAAGPDVLPSRAVYSDNAALGRMVVSNFNQYFDRFRDCGFAELEPQPARFLQQADGRRLHRITCTTGAASIELLWQDVLDAALEIFYNTSGPLPYDVSAVICICARASISVNGKPVTGEVRRPDGGSASSAFLAFSETWVAR
jgi:hypothetical protein